MATCRRRDTPCTAGLAIDDGRRRSRGTLPTRFQRSSRSRQRLFSPPFAQTGLPLRTKWRLSNDWHCRVLTKAPIFRPDNRSRSREPRQVAPTEIPHRGRSVASHLRHRGTHLYIVNVVEIRVLHFFDVTLRNLTEKSVNTTVGAAVVPETTCAHDGVANDESRLAPIVIGAVVNNVDYCARECSIDVIPTQVIHKEIRGFLISSLFLSVVLTIQLQLK